MDQNAILALEPIIYQTRNTSTSNLGTLGGTFTVNRYFGDQYSLPAGIVQSQGVTAAQRIWVPTSTNKAQGLRFSNVSNTHSARNEWTQYYNYVSFQHFISSTKSQRVTFTTSHLASANTYAFVVVVYDGTAYHLYFKGHLLGVIPVPDISTPVLWFANADRYDRYASYFAHSCLWDRALTYEEIQAISAGEMLESSFEDTNGNPLGLAGMWDGISTHPVKAELAGG